MVNHMKLLIKGYIIGLAKIIPGVSGALLAISLNVYKQSLEAITHFFNKTKDNIKLLLPLGIGIIFAIITGSKAVLYCLDKAYVITMILFIGLILGGIPNIYHKANHSKVGYIITIISLLVILSLGLIHQNQPYVIQNTPTDLIIYLTSGVIDALGTVIPGVSSTALLMLYGSYNVIMTAISMVDLFILTYYGIGMLIGIITISIIMNYLFNHYQEQTYSSILGIVLSSIILLLAKVIPNISNIQELIIGIPLLVLGTIISHKLD